MMPPHGLPTGLGLPHSIRLQGIRRLLWLPWAPNVSISVNNEMVGVIQELSLRST